MSIITYVIIPWCTSKLPLAHTSALFKNLKILKFNDINTYLLACRGFKQYKLVINQPFHWYNTRGSVEPRTPNFNLTLARHAVPYRAPEVWRNLPACLKNINSFSLFKRGVKDYLISKY